MADKKLILLLLTLALCLLTALQAKANEISIAPVFSVTHEDFSWNIASSQNGVDEPNILSELTWYGLVAHTYGAELTIQRDTCVGFALAGEYGDIKSGKVQDSDYNGNNRTQEFSRSISDTAGDRVELSITSYCKKNASILNNAMTLSIQPGFGFIYSAQRRELFNGLQIIDITALPGDDPNIIGLDSHYTSAWTGPFLNFDIIIKPRRFISLAGNIRAYLTDYFAQANWNLRDEFAHPVSFEHSSNGLGYDASIYLNIYPTSQLAIGASYRHRYWRTTSGIDKTYVVDTDGNVSTGVTRLNGAFWLAKNISTYIKLTF